ncbi:Putative 2EXR domain-containing protein [Colletotrichum destructivum]|uniref:2EXR domain-containing protein n=1 Tax=Colletotrichum destructivum TaxID=34406 RepID=A0AAX4I8T2_9PEZI|nr:Putative 2EXR domain-containing protein [Colletotrichum destructivum]
MGITTFHPFPQLPGELRDVIWDHAVRPVDLRGVQYFSFYTNHEVPEKIKSHLMPLSHTYQREVLGAPLADDDALTASWNHNKSTYAIDGALWTTCKESRAAMHRRYNLCHWADLYDDPCRPLLSDSSRLSIRHEDYKDLPAIFPVHDSNNWQYITVLPRRDLIMLQTWDVDDFSSLGDGHMFSSMPRGFVSFADIAVEFDPSWDYDELEEYQQEWIHGDLSYNFKYDRPRWATYRLLLDAMKEMHNTRLWMVDRRLRLQATALDERSTSVMRWETRVVFRGDGCKYYEIPDSCSDLCLIETDEDAACLSFVWMLEQMCREQLEKDFDDLERESDYEEYPLHIRSFQSWGVLACEEA